MRTLSHPFDLRTDSRSEPLKAFIRVLQTTGSPSSGGRRAGSKSSIPSATGLPSYISPV